MVTSEKAPLNRLCFIHMAVLACGCLVGVAVAAFVSNLPIDFSAEIGEARRLGIVSKTILAGYPKSRDILFYAAFILLPITISLGAWIVWGRRHRSDLAALFRIEPTPMVARLPARPFLALVTVIVSLLIPFNINNFYETAGGWAFFGEEGQFLAHAQILLDGGDYARDFFCLYGPLVTYPLAFAMKLFGASVMVGRCYTYGLTIVSAVIIVTMLNVAMRNRGLFIIASLFMMAIFIDGGDRTSPTYLRVLLGYVPLLILFRNALNELKFSAAISGVSLGISLLFSQEVGLCAVIATLVFLHMETRATKTYRRLASQVGQLTIGCCLVVLPMLGYFYRHNALGRFFESLYGYPKLVTLGFGSLPFPSFSELMAAPLTGRAYFPYWIIGIYLLAAISLSVVIFLGQANRDTHFRVSLLVFGMLLFRAALGRSDESHFYFALSPALMLTFLMLDDAFRELSNCPVQVLKTGRCILIGGLVLSLVLLCGTSRILRNSMVRVYTELNRFPSKFNVQETGVALPQMTRAGVLFDRATAHDIVKIGQALDHYTRPGDNVLFFPNEAAYYFLFNRSVPTRYVHAYFAVTTDQRREMVNELEQSRPAYVIYTLNSWRIDDIPEYIQVPEVVSYLREKYTPVEDLGGILVLRRKSL